MGMMGTKCGAGAVFALVLLSGGALSASSALAQVQAREQTREQTQSQACGKPEFEAVVETAAATLRDLNAQNKPGFQSKLRTLKDKRGWSTEQFLAEAAVYVQDDRIGALDAKSGDLLSRLNTMGEAGAAAKTPDCKLLTELRATMKSLVDTQTEKWSYMFAKLEKALGP